MLDTTDEALSPDELKKLRDIGFSAEMVAICRQDPEIVGKSRNSTREVAHMVLARTEMADEDRYDWAVSRHGHFFGALAEGDLERALARADVTNTRLLLATFGRAYLIERVVSEVGTSIQSREEATRWVDGTIERLGDGILL
jgi:hypothetical protein